MTIPQIKVDGKVILLRPMSREERQAAGYESIHNPTGLVAALCDHGVKPEDLPPGVLTFSAPARSYIRSGFLDQNGYCPMDVGRYRGPLPAGELPEEAWTPANNPPLKAAHCPEAS